MPNVFRQFAHNPPYQPANSSIDEHTAVDIEILFLPPEGTITEHEATEGGHVLDSDFPVSVAGQFDPDNVISEVTTEVYFHAF